VLDFAVGQILRYDTALGALPAVLDRLVSVFGLRAALAFQPAAAAAGQPAGRPPARSQRSAVLAMHPADSVDDQLLARIVRLTMAQRDTSAGPLTVTLGGRAASVLLVHSAPVAGHCLCALALIGDVAGWDDEVRATAHAVAAMVATQIRHANDMNALAERQTLTRALIAGAPVAVLAMDAEGRLVEFNPAAEKLSGYRRQDILGRPMSELLVPERDRSRFLEHIGTYVATGDPGKFTGQIRVPMLHADGTERITELTPVQITISGQTIFTGFLRDLTEIERSHAALAEQTERLNHLITAAIPGVLITDEQGIVTNASESFGAMFGLAEPSRLAGTPAVAVMRHIRRMFADQVLFTRRIGAVVRARQPLTGEQIQAADGRTIEGDYWPVLVDGVYRGDIWLAWDMSDRRELEQQRLEKQQQLTEQNERLRKLDAARNQFLAIVSHELRTPLTSIVSFTELIRGESEGLTPDGIRFLDIIERNADRLHRLVGDLLMLDRLEAGALPLDLAPVSVPDLALEAVRSASPGAAKQGITIDLKPGTGPDIQGDHRRLMQVLDNLIANAVKFSHRNQQVRVTADYDGRQWRIGISDRGIGIPEAEAGQLFSRFVRASNARNAGLPGTGLGLSIVKVLAEMHGGRVDVASTLGQGSTFTVYLPGPEASVRGRA
jgi:PAS domain S-box-containing protein